MLRLLFQVTLTMLDYHLWPLDEVIMPSAIKKKIALTNTNSYTVGLLLEFQGLSEGLDLRGLGE